MLPRDLTDDWPVQVIADVSGEVARNLANSLKAAIAGRPLRAIKDQTGVDHTTISDILNGRTWADLRTIARLEAGLDVDIWPVGVARAAQEGL